MDNNVEWKEYIDYIAKKITEGIGVLIKAREVFDI